MEKAREFFTRTLRTPEAMKLLEGIAKPASLEEIINVYADVARQLGTELTTGEIKAYFEEKLNQPCAEGLVDDKEMTQVAGGGKKYPDVCDKTFEMGEWCWLNDHCTHLMTQYSKYCNYTFKPGENCYFRDTCNIFILNKP